MQIATDAVASWSATRPELAGHFERDADAHAKFWRKGADLLAALPEKPKRNAAEARAAETILRTGRESREAFMGRHAEAVYRALTKDMTALVRAEPLVYDAANVFPGLTPTRQEVAAQSDKPQRDKDGIEIDQGIFFSRVLAHPAAGAHLCHAMLLPKPESVARLPELQARGTLDQSQADASSSEREGRSSQADARSGERDARSSRFDEPTSARREPSSPGSAHFPIGISSALGCAASCSRVTWAVRASLPDSFATTPPEL